MRLLVVVWIAVLVAGFGAWGLIERVPGPTGAASEASAATPGPSVVVYLHPQCPCSRRALAGLLEAFAAAPAEADCRVVFVRPAGMPEGWERTRSWDLVAGQPGVTVEVDPGGVRAAADGAKTSGHAVVRDSAGRVVFRGGFSRPGSNESTGLRAIAAVLAGRAPDAGEAPTFGCPLETPAE